MSLPSLSILLIEDNVTIAKQLAEFFEGHAWHLDFAQTGKQGLALALSHSFDVVLLDLNLPDIDGIELCRKIKSQSDINLPVLMLTARDSFEDKAEGFSGGADDYLTKPFDFRELALRCQALARRSELHKAQRIEIGDLVIDKNQHLASRENKALKLTNIGFQILASLAQAYPQAVTRSQLVQKVWGEDAPDSDALRSHIYSLRSALDKPFAYGMLETITSVGYKLSLNNIKNTNSEKPCDSI